MSKVVKLVSAMMLIYPTLYPTRNDALKGLFLSSNYVWNDAGELVPVHESSKTFEGPIDLSDLDRSDERHADITCDFDRAVVVGNELERRTRLYRAEHIELFAARHLSPSNRSYDYHTLDSSYLDSEYSSLFTAPFGSIDAEWARVMETFIDDLMVAFNHTFFLHYDKPLPDEPAREGPTMFSRMPEAMQRRHTRLMEVSEKLEAQTGSRAERHRFINSPEYRRMMAEIKSNNG